MITLVHKGFPRYRHDLENTNIYLYCNICPELWIQFSLFCCWLLLVIDRFCTHPCVSHTIAQVPAKYMLRFVSNFLFKIMTKNCICRNKVVKHDLIFPHIAIAIQQYNICYVFSSQNTPIHCPDGLMRVFCPCDCVISTIRYILGNFIIRIFCLPAKTIQ